MKYKECIKKVGIKNVIKYELLYLLEILINSPYLLIRGIFAIYNDVILDFIIFLSEKQQKFLCWVFEKERIISLSKISKKVDYFREKTIKKLRS